MEIKESKQHYQLPNSMEEKGLTPKDQLIYISIKSFDGKEGCFPSLQKIAEVSGASIPTIRESIKRLEKAEYIEVKKKGRGQEYIFNEYKKFEPFSPEFLKNKDISFTTKSYLIASQQYMFKEQEGLGKISLTNTKLSDIINMPESTIRKCNNELVRKDYLCILKNKNKDLVTGCHTDTKVYDLNKLGQAIIWILCNHEDRITNVEEKLEQQSILINKLIEENNKLKEHIKYTM